MRSQLISVFCLFAIGCMSAATAQETFGIRLGVNAATLTGDFASSSGAEHRVGFAAGIYGALPLRYGLLLQSEILYTQKGFRPTDSTLVASTQPTVELTYIEIPVLLKYPLSIGSVRVDPYVGPFASFKLAERLRIDEFGEGTSESTEDLVSTDAGLMVGGDLHMPVGTLDLVLGGRYARGLKNLLEQRVLNRGLSSSAFTSTFSFFVGLNL